MDQMVKYAIFGDGCAAAVLSAQELQPGDGKWIVEGISLKICKIFLIFYSMNRIKDFYFLRL